MQDSSAPECTYQATCTSPFIVIGGQKFKTEKRTPNEGFCANDMCGPTMTLDSGCDTIVKGGDRSGRLINVKRRS